MATVMEATPLVEMEQPPPSQPPDLYEIIDGEFVETPPMSVQSLSIANDLSAHFVLQCRTFGRSFVEMIFRIPTAQDENRARRPDFAFVPFELWPSGESFPRENAWDIVPPLVVEVVSPSDVAEGLLDKIVEYLNAGVQLVWVIYPSQRLIYVYESPTRVRGLGPADELDGGAVLPRFRLPVATLMPAPATPST